MAFIQVYFNGVLQDEVELRLDPSDPVSIGRDPENDIFIDNAGISALHAVIWREGDAFVVADTASTNGVSVNGARFQRKPLKLGDEIQVLKYTLKFVDSSSGVEIPKPPRPTSGRNSQKTTIEVDVADLNGRVQQRGRNSAAYLTFSQGHAVSSDHPLNKAQVKIGKAWDCEIRTNGWLEPPVAASILRRSDGYYLRPERRGKVNLNRIPISESKKLKNGDRFTVRGRELTFHERTSE